MYAHTIFKQLHVRKIGSLRVAIHACVCVCVGGGDYQISRHNDVNCSLKIICSISEIFISWLWYAPVAAPGDWWLPLLKALLQYPMDPPLAVFPFYYFLFNLGNLNKVAIIIKFCCCI